MGRNRFVKPAVVRLPLSDDDWIEIKARLTWGESKKLEASGFRSVSNFQGGVENAEITVDIDRTAIELLATYLIDWSLRDETDKSVRITRSSIAALDPDDAEEIEQAISNYLQEQEQAKKARKQTAI